LCVLMVAAGVWKVVGGVFVSFRFVSFVRSGGCERMEMNEWK